MDLIFATLTIAIKISRNKIKEFFGEKVNDKLLAIFFFSLLLSRLSDSLFWIFLLNHCNGAERTVFKILFVFYFCKKVEIKHLKLIS
jgi:hypothetical protein